MHPAAVGYQCPDCLREAAGSLPRARRVLVLGGPGTITRALMAINIAVFVVEVVVGGGASIMDGPSPQHLVDLGGLFPVFVANGQYWRLITAMFLHANLLHIAFNMWALYILGPAIENWYGPRRFLILYFLTGFLASVGSFVFGPVISVGVGASGAIFGLLGAWLAYNYLRRENPLASANLRWAVTLIAINLFLSFSFRGIDWRAHVGGLVTGTILGFCLEGVGTGNVRRLVQVAGPAALVGAGIVMTLAHVQTIRALFNIG
jgi:membrane associated rhomboid family serine protease